MEQTKKDAGTTPELVRLAGVSKQYDGGVIVALGGVDLSIAEGDCLAVLGPSGSGKSTLISMLSGFDVPSGGAVYWRGEPVRKQTLWTELRRRQIGIVFQEFNLIPTLTTLENVEIAMFGCGIAESERRRRAECALARVNLTHRRNNLPLELSGGERQRAAIARSIIHEPKLLLADEPTGNLDRRNGDQVADLLFDVGQKHGAALVLVTHDEALAERCSRKVRLLDGRVSEQSR